MVRKMILLIDIKEYIIYSMNKFHIFISNISILIFSITVSTKDTISYSVVSLSFLFLFNNSVILN